MGPRSASAPGSRADLSVHFLFPDLGAADRGTRAQERLSAVLGPRSRRIGLNLLLYVAAAFLWPLLLGVMSLAGDAGGVGEGVGAGLYLAGLAVLFLPIAALLFVGLEGCARLIGSRATRIGGMAVACGLALAWWQTELIYEDGWTEVGSLLALSFVLAMLFALIRLPERARPSERGHAQR